MRISNSIGEVGCSTYDFGVDLYVHAVIIKVNKEELVFTMPYYVFFWYDDNLEHIAEHGVTTDEFEEIVCDPERVEASRSSNRLIAFGESKGRCLVCVYEMMDDTNVLPITAYEVE